MKVLIIYQSMHENTPQKTTRFERIADILDGAGLEALCAQIFSIEHFQSLIEIEKPDIVYSADYFLPSKNDKPACVHEWMEKNSIPFVGSSSQALERVLQKSAIKKEWMDKDLFTLPFCEIGHEMADEISLDKFLRSSNFPYIIKPDREGNSRGIDESCIIFTKESLLSKMNELLNSYNSVLIEEYIGHHKDIREFTVALIGKGSCSMILPAEIILKEQKPYRLITTTDKDEHMTKAVPVKDITLHNRLTDFADKAFNIAQMRDYSRVDILMSDGNLYALEINGLPMIPDKWFEVCAADMGLNPDQYIIAIFIAGILRNMKEGMIHKTLQNRTITLLPHEFWRRLCESSWGDDRI